MTVAKNMPKFCSPLLTMPKYYRKSKDTIDHLPKRTYMGLIHH
jgi:hypothetical protein